jgi:hypothetical protein
MARHPTQAPWSCERLEYEQSIALGTILEPASHASYSSVLQSYTDFCTHHNFPFNPTPNTLSLYVVYMCHHLKPKSVSSYLSGICDHLQPIYPDVQNNCKHKLVVNTLRRSTKLHAVATSHKHTITCKELNTACRQLKPCHTHNQKLFHAILLTGFHGLMCLSELTWPDKPALQDYCKVTLQHTVTATKTNYSFFLPFHKADHLFEGNHFLIQTTNTDDNPVTAFNAYLQSCDTKFPSTQSFGFMQTVPYQLVNGSCTGSPYFSPEILEANPFVQVVHQPMQKQVFPDTSSKPLATPPSTLSHLFPQHHNTTTPI